MQRTIIIKENYSSDSQEVSARAGKTNIGLTHRRDTEKKSSGMFQIDIKIGSLGAEVWSLR